MKTERRIIIVFSGMSIEYCCERRDALRRIAMIIARINSTDILFLFTIFYDVRREYGFINIFHGKL